MVGCSRPFLFGTSLLDRAKLDEIIALVNRTLHPAGFDCLEAEWSGSDRILRLFVDLLDDSQGGVTLDSCVRASRLLEESPELDALTPAHYTLEVSSPGVERPLRSAGHFSRHVGERVQVKLVEKVQDRRNGVGKLLQVKDSLITLETEQGPWQFPLAALQRASLVYDWDAG